MDFFYHTIIVINSWLPVALGYTFLFGRGKIFHFGPIGTWAAVSYAIVVTLVSTQNPLLALLVGILMSIVISSLFAWLSFRLEPDGLGVMTIAVHLAILAIILNWNSVTRGSLGIPGVPRLSFMSTTESFAFVTSLISICSIAVFVMVNRSAFGRRVEALAEHEWYAKSLGINKTVVHFLAFILLGFATVASSYFYHQYLFLLHPNEYQFPTFILFIMIVVAGKPGSLWGATLSCILLSTLRELLRFAPLSADILGPTRLIIFGSILFIAVWWRRDTLFPHRRKI